jgi:hypothetical protein
MQVFKVKYGNFPGDMPNAVQLWGKADGDANLATNCASPATDFDVNKPTCNGNGNGAINRAGESTLCESYRAWEHLAAAEMIDGVYTGVSGLALCALNSTPIVNSPESKLASSSFSVTSYGEFAGNSSAVFFDGNYDNVILFGATRANDFAINPAITPINAAEMDQKSDDGTPATGLIRAFGVGSIVDTSPTPSCVNGVGGYNESYRDTDKNLACALIFMNGFASRP